MIQSRLLELIQTFVRIVEVGSFTGVANELNSTQPTISRKISQLETHLGSRLFHRTTRVLRLTDEGRLYYNHAVGILSAVDSAAASVAPNRDNVSGTLRISGAGAFSRIQIIPRLPRFLRKYPNIKFDFVLDDKIVDLHESRVDVSIRIGHVNDRQLVVTKICEMQRVAVATPDYLQQYGTPERPEDLARHECVIYSGLPSADVWQFFDVNTKEEIRVKVRERISANSPDAAIAAVICGIGVGIAPDWALAAAIDSGVLNRLLERFETPPMPINIIYPARKTLRPEIKVLIDFLKREFSEFATPPEASLQEYEANLINTVVNGNRY